jgi:hypothetical protein
MKESNGAGVVADYTCSLPGRECATRISGHQAKETFYFNGPKLVEIQVGTRERKEHRPT